jgi:hypothetical protein
MAAFKLTDVRLSRHTQAHNVALGESCTDTVQRDECLEERGAPGQLVPGELADGLVQARPLHVAPPQKLNIKYNFKK